MKDLLWGKQLIQRVFQWVQMLPSPLQQPLPCALAFASTVGNNTYFRKRRHASGSTIGPTESPGSALASYPPLWYRLGE